jgi:hypothetical protein
VHYCREMKKLHWESGGGRLSSGLNEMIIAEGSMWVVLAAVAASVLAFCATSYLLRRRLQKNERRSFPPLFFASTPDVMFAYHQSGSTRHPLVLVLHGFPDTAASFCDFLLPSLAAQGNCDKLSINNRRYFPAACTLSAMHN